MCAALNQPTASGLQTQLRNATFQKVLSQISKMYHLSFYLACNCGALQQGGGPGPLGDDGGGSQPDRDLAPCVECCVQVVCVPVDIFSHLGVKLFIQG